MLKSVSFLFFCNTIQHFMLHKMLRHFTIVLISYIFILYINKLFILAHSLLSIYTYVPS